MSVRLGVVVVGWGEREARMRGARLTAAPFDVIRTADPRLRIACPEFVGHDGMTVADWVCDAAHSRQVDGVFNAARAWLDTTVTQSLDDLAVELLDIWERTRPAAGGSGGPGQRPRRWRLGIRDAVTARLGLGGRPPVTWERAANIGGVTTVWIRQMTAQIEAAAKAGEWVWAPVLDRALETATEADRPQAFAALLCERGLARRSWHPEAVYSLARLCGRRPPIASGPPAEVPDPAEVAAPASPEEASSLDGVARAMFDGWEHTRRGPRYAAAGPMSSGMRQAIQARLGLFGRTPVTMREAGAIAGVSGQRVRQLAAVFEAFCGDWTSAPVLDEALVLAEGASGPRDYTTILSEHRLTETPWVPEAVNALARLCGRAERVTFTMEPGKPAMLATDSGRPVTVARRPVTVVPDPTVARGSDPTDAESRLQETRDFNLTVPGAVSHRLDVLLRNVTAPGGALYTNDEAAARINQLAEQHVISGSDLHQIRAGTASMPSLDTLFWIAKLFDLPVAYFLRESPDPPADGHPDTNRHDHPGAGGHLDTDERDRLVTAIVHLTNGLSTGALEAVRTQLRHARIDEGLPAIPTATDSGTSQSTTTRRPGTDPPPVQATPLRPRRAPGRPPPLSIEQRRASSDKKRADREARAAILAAVRAGELTAHQLVQRHEDPIVAQIRLNMLIPKFPGWDEARTTLLLTTLGAPARRMIRGLSPLQRQRLAEMLALGPELIERALAADEDTPGP